MRKMTRMVLISAIFVTSGLTAKIATENYKAVVDNDERIHKAYENAKKPTKAAVLEAIVDAANAEPDERIRDAVVIDSEEPKVVRIKTKVTTSAGVSPISSVMDKKTVNKAEEFIEEILHPVNIPDCNIPIRELTYEIKDIFPEFEEETVVVLGNTYDFPKIMTWPEGTFTNTLNRNGENTYTDGIFTYTLTDGNYVRTHDAFLSDTIADDTTTTLSGFESTEDTNLLLLVSVWGRTDFDFGKMAINQFSKPTSGTEVTGSDWIEGGVWNLQYAAGNTTYTIEGTNDTGIYFKPTGSARQLLNLYDGIKAGTIYHSEKAWSYGS